MNYVYVIRNNEKTVAAYLGKLGHAYSYDCFLWQAFGFTTEDAAWKQVKRQSAYVPDTSVLRVPADLVGEVGEVL